MAKGKKRELSESEVTEALAMIGKQKKTISAVAKHFGVNKPTLLKACQLWNTGLKTATNGNTFYVERGKMKIQVKDIPEEVANA